MSDRLGSRELQPLPAAAVVDHVGHPAFSLAELFGDDAGVAILAVDEQVLDGFVAFAVDLFHDDPGPAHAEFVAFPAHGLDDDGHLELAAALDGL